VLGEQDQYLANLNSGANLHFFISETCQYSRKLFFQNQVLDHVTLRHELERLSCQVHLFRPEQLPIVKLVHNLVKNFVEVLVNRRVCVAKLPRLFNQVFAEQILALGYLAVLAPSAILVFLLNLRNALLSRCLASLAFIVRRHPAA
jgi:hypothetical protein